MSTCCSSLQSNPFILVHQLPARFCDQRFGPPSCFLSSTPRNCARRVVNRPSIVRTLANRLKAKTFFVGLISSEHQAAPRVSMTSSVSASTLPGVLDGAKSGSAVGLVVAGGGPKLTHAQLKEQIESVGAQLRGFGVKPGDLVTLAFPNTIEFVVAFLAVARIRAVAAPLNAAYKEDEFTFYIEDAKSSFLVVPKEGVPNAEAAAKTLNLPILVVSFSGLEEGVKVAKKSGDDDAKKQEAKDAGPLPEEDDEALFLHTSGTTSRPKGVPLSHLNLATSIRNIIKTYELTPEDRTLIVMPLFHVHGLMASLLATLASGGAVVLPAGGRFSATTFWEDALAHAITWYTAVPTIHQILLAKQKTAPVPPEQRPRLRFIRSCSSSLAPAVLEKLEAEFDAPVLEAYAMTEASHQMTSNPLPKHGPHKPGTVGKATGIELAVLDEQDRPVPTGEIGEVSIKGANVTKGYKANPEANKVAFTSGWFHTGDRGKLDSEGYLTLTGRIKELINRGGEKISPIEVDEALLAHPAVSEAVAFAAPDEKYGEEVNAAVVLNPNEKVTGEDILAHIKDRLSAFKLPKKIFIATEMPRTATGKIQRRKVAEHFLGAAEKAEKAGDPLKEVASTTAGPGGSAQAKPVDGADLVARSLAKMGVKYLFGVVGIPVTALATFAQKAGIRFIGLRNEQAAGYGAGAAGYLTGVPGALLTVSGPGAVHGLAGLSNGLANSWPIVMISGSAPTEEVGRGGFQELDQIAIVRPFVKYAGRAENVRAVPNIVQSAVSAAAAGRPGAAYVDVPAEVLHQEVSEAEAAALLNTLVDIRPFYTPGGLRKALSAPPPDVAAAVALLRNAKSPLVVFGKGAAYAHAEDAIRSLVDRTGIPFVATPMGKGVVPDSHPLNVGAARSLALAGADVALVVGAQLNWLLHFGEPPRWGKDVKFIQIDISEDELKLRKPAVPLLGDANAVLEQINVAIKDEPFSLGRDHPWVAKLRAKADANGTKLAESLARDCVPMNFQCSMRVVRDELAKVEGPHPILVSEGANTMDVGRTVLNQNEPRTRLDAGTWGTMGVGMGYAIAAAVVNDGKRLVVAVEGDSAFGFSAVEVEVLVRYNLPVVVVVFNNSGIYGGDRREDAELGGPYASDPAPTDFVSEARYEQIIEAFGGKGYFVRTPAELAAACQEAFAAKKPAVINAIIDPFAGSESGRMHSRN